MQTIYSININKKSDIENKSFRVAQIYDQFDIQKNSVEENFIGTIEVPEEWNIGVIVGKSGTGKSSIINEYFKDYICNFKYKNKCVIDDFNKNNSTSDIFKILSSVGFSSPPSWLKPYSVLSNGEKMRVNLARAILKDNEIIVFDEFTSVVDREIAKIGSLAVSNAIRKYDKKFIAVTCHFDVLEWLQPDWIFSTDEMQNLPRGQLRRPKIKIEIRKVRGYWKYFRRYHYLNHDLKKSSVQYVGFYNDKPICFCAIHNLPHPKYKPMLLVHRIVVLPDYQGLGIGIKLLNFIAEQYKKNKYFGIITSLNGFARSIIKNKNWRLIRVGHANKNINMKQLNTKTSSNRNTYSFRYVPER